jgi:hypothetical protein
MIKLHLFTHLALATFVLIGILIAIHDKIKSLTWVYFEKSNSYNAKARTIYRIIIALCFVGVTLMTLNPILPTHEIIGKSNFNNNMLVSALNFMVVIMNLVLGVYIGNKISKIFSNP